MSEKIILVAFFAIMSLGLYSQRSTIELTFTAVNNMSHIQLDSIKIMNRTQGGETVLLWPDTVLTVLWVGIPESSSVSDGFNLYQNYPNPVGDQTTVEISVPEQGRVNLMVSDMLGRTAYSRDMVLTSGLHTLKFTPGNEALYFLSVTWQGLRRSIKILHYGPGDNQRCSLSYLGSSSLEPELKSRTSERDLIISPGDELLYIGYADTLQTGMLDTPEESETYTFQFATNIPCPGTPTVEYEGQVYKTIQIFSQCWLKENLNVGGMIEGTIEQSNNGTIEKYCYNNEPDSCVKYGGLYQWNEMMQYTTQQGIQGICPPGWYIPTDEEWKVLEGAVDSQYGIGDPEWDIPYDYRGFDAGTNLKTTSGWNEDGNGTDLFGFSGLPGGLRNYGGNFSSVGSYGDWWTATEDDDFIAWFRRLICGNPEVGRNFTYFYMEKGFSVRCLRDE